LGTRTLYIFMTGIVLVLALCYWMPIILVSRYPAIPPSERFAAENAARVTIIQGLGLASLVFGGYYTLRGVRVNQERQITGRFSQAIELLGKTDRLELRLGGIYALERIAADSERDHWPVMEILTAFVRERSPHRREKPQVSGSLPADSYRAPRDVQAAITVIARRVRTWGRGEKRDPGATLLSLHDQRLDLCEADLRQVLMNDGNFAGAYFVDSALDGAFLERTDLTEAVLLKTTLVGVNLRQAHLPRAALDLADLTDADLSGADLRGATLRGANLARTKLDKTDLRGADLGEFAAWQAQNLEKEQIQMAILDGTTVLPFALSREMRAQEKLTGG